MNEQLINNTPIEEFEAVTEAHIEREAKDMGELDAPLFYETFQDMLDKDSGAELLEAEGVIVNNQLVVDLPAGFVLSNPVGDIAILVGGRRVVVKLQGDTVIP